MVKEWSGPADDPGVSTALLCDRYELTALAAAIGSGVAARPAAFEVFTRSLPKGRAYGVVAGTARIIEALHAFRFTPAELAFLDQIGILTPALTRWLDGWRFDGDIDGYREGDLYFPYSPVLTVRGRFGDCLLLETLVLSVLNHDAAVASAAARMVDVAADRPIIEAGGRRTHERSAVAAARSAYLAGFASTSNLEAGRTHGIPTVGTTMHAFILAHSCERAAFDAQIDAMGCDTTFLVDTYDIATGIRTAVEACQARGDRPGAVRLDSGDPVETAFLARTILDANGCSETKVVLSSDLDEFVIDQVVRTGAPVDRFMVGTRVVTGSGAPTAGFVYKLVAIADEAGVMQAVEKRATGKRSIGGIKAVNRRYDAAGHIVADVSSPNAEPVGDRIVAYWRAGAPSPSPSLAESQHFGKAERAALRDRNELQSTTNIQCVHEGSS